MHLQACRLANFNEKIVVCCWFYIIVAGATFGRLISSVFVLNKNKHNTLHLLVRLCCREEVDPPQLQMRDLQLWKFGDKLEAGRLPEYHLEGA